MNASDTAGAPQRVTCPMCMKEIPTSEAIVPEATDYVAHFCGLQCYDRWRKQPTRPATPANLPPSHGPA